jgi:hypothetical protein
MWIPQKVSKKPLLGKAAQKFLLIWGMGVVPDNAHAPD